MALFRSKKRDTESLGEIPSSLEKKHRGMSGSVGDLLDIDKDDQDTATDGTESSDSDIEETGMGKISRKQKIFAKKSIKREKKKEKEQRKKVEKNTISMDDFLRKQSEFKMWLYEEKSKNAGDLSSPKLKSLFKQFVRSWNKRKLPQKYYRSLSCPDSPSPLTPKKFNFMTDDEDDKSPLPDAATDPEVKEPPKSPFVTFGKTPPKVLRSKRLQLFPSSQDVALISVVPIGSPQVVPVTNKENTDADTNKVYNVPKVKRKQISGKSSTTENNTEDQKPAIPYKVSVFPWAVSKDGAADADTSLEVCSTATPPYTKFPQDQEDEKWPTPPTDLELNGCLGNGRKNKSPHVPPPPPPPRSESLSSSRDLDFPPPPPPIASTYADPYDRLPDPNSKPTRYTSEYQEPVDSVVAVNSRTKPDNATEVRNTFSSQTGQRKENLGAKQASEKREFSQDELEELYAKPLKRRKEVSSETEKTDRIMEEDFQSDLYCEIMAHLNKNKTPTKSTSKRIDPDYETIDECLAKIHESDAKRCSDEAVDKNEGKEKTSAYTPTNSSEQHFAKLTKAKKRTVLAASSDKIYETYLSMGRNANPFKTKSLKEKMKEEEPNTLRKRFKSQPDVSFSDGLQVHDSIDINKQTDTDSSTPTPFLSSFKPVDVQCNISGSNNVFKKEISNRYKLSNRAKSYEDGLREINAPGTPTILATPSFDSLCAVTPLSKRSGSSQSLPTKTGSSESLSEMSTSTCSSLSYAPDEQSGSMQSLHSEKSLPPVPEEISEKDYEPDLRKDEKKADPQDRYKPCLGPLTPGKITGGIDLSVYLLKPTKIMTESNSNTCSAGVKESGNETGSNINDQLPKLTEQVRQLQDSQTGSKLFDTQSRLAIKDTLSGVKTKVDHSKAPSKETERRHTVQTVHEIKVSMAQKLSNTPGQVPAIGIKSKARKFKKSNEDVSGDNANIAGAKGQTDETNQVVSVGDDKYLETDIDVALTDKGRQPLKKSKSHSGFEQGSSTVVTEIW